jgi:DNA-binding response OmpR family regulator
LNPTPLKEIAPSSIWALNVGAKQLALMGDTIDLTAKECRFLHLLTLGGSPVLSTLIVVSSGVDDGDVSHDIEAMVHRLRMKARKGLGQELPVRHVYGEGYVLSANFTLT